MAQMVLVAKSCNPDQLLDCVRRGASPIALLISSMHPTRGFTEVAL